MRILAPLAALRLALISPILVALSLSVVHAELSIDKSFGQVSGWNIGFSEDIGGCVAAAKYKDETTIWLGFGDKSYAYIAFTNPKWESINRNGEYQLRLITGRRVWVGTFAGFERTGEKGIFSSGLKAEFLDDFAAAGGVRVFLNQKPVSALSLTGSRDALNQVISCQKTYLEASGGGPEKGKKGGESSGTGFFVSNDGHIVTNNHVIEGCKAIEVTPVGSRATSAYVVSRDKTNDLAIIKTTMPPTVLPAIRSQPRLGEPVYVFGFPLTGLLATSGNFTTGSVTAVSGMGDDTRFLQISAPVQPGNSGGPLIDKFGNVVGVIVAKLDALKLAALTKDIPQNVNFAIKSNIALNFLESNNLAANTSAKSRELPAEAIAELANLFTVRITCN
jgi:serine protease Do